MAENKKEAVKETVEKAVEAAKTEAAVVKETAKKATKKTAAAAKKTAAKADAAVKKTAKKAAEKVEAKKAAIKKEVVQLQFNGKDLSVEEIVAAAKADFKAKNKGTIKTVEVYVKPEDNAAYYVINGIADKIDL